MIRVFCTTNIDTFRHVKWPEELAACPRIGEDVRALEPAYIKIKHSDGEIVGTRIDHPTLRVVGVTHIGRDPNRKTLMGPEAYVIVELHHPHAKELGWLY
jgi:hypothetical protein